MVSVYGVNANKLIERAAEELKKIEQMKPLSWAGFVKTGASRERPPSNPDWWYIRAAAILRSIYKLGPVGVSKLRTKYGGRKRRGARPEEFRKGSGNIIRKILQQLESAELVKKGEVGVHKGRLITPKGKSILDKVSVGIIKEMPKPVIEKEVKKEETKPTEKVKPKKENKPAVKKEEVKKEEVKKEEVKPVVEKPKEEKNE